MIPRPLLALACCAALACGCLGLTPPDDAADSGSVSGPGEDAGANGRDAGMRDAGTREEDAGGVAQDAGEEEPDPEADGGVLPDGGAPLPICPCYEGEGPYCGAGVAVEKAKRGCRVNALAGHEKDILTCTAGRWKVTATCANGCEATSPGEGDACSLPVCACFVQTAWCGSGAAKEGLTKNPPCRVPLVPEHNDDILACNGNTWIVKQSCANGCFEAPAGVPDGCNIQSPYKLPYACNSTFTCTQENFGSSHQGSQKYAWDFGMPKDTPVHAARAGTVKYLEIRSPPGSVCYDPPGVLEECHNKGNFVGVRHADGTVALYLHLRSAAVKVGDAVKQGDKLGMSGNSGYTSGPHLHFQVQTDCGIWFCDSVPSRFADAPTLAKGVAAKSANNCP